MFKKNLITSIAIISISIFALPTFASYSPIIDDCFIRADIEPNPVSLSNRSSSIKVKSASTGSDWIDVLDASREDQKMAVSTMLAEEKSKTLSFSGFYHDIPLGATIHGVQLRIAGSSTNSGTIIESNIQFYLDGSPIGINLAGKSNISNPWKETHSSWFYGYEYSDWGINWTREILRSPALSLSLQLGNSSDQDVLEVGVDALELVVHYTEAYTVCSTDCVVLYNDEVLGATEYLWSVPPGVKFLNNDPTNQVVNLDFADAAYGLLEVGLNIVKGLDTLSCSRYVLHENCSTAAIGDYIWFDTNFNGSQDIDEEGIDGVSLQLLDAYGGFVQSITSTSMGFYQFEDVQKGFYKIQIVTSDYIASPFQKDTKDIDSDLLTDLSSGILYISGGDSLTNLDFGLFSASSIAGTVWNECEGNGILDTSDIVINNQVVQLWEGSSLSTETSTDDNGFYQFDQLIVGNYTLKLKDIDAVSNINQAVNPDVDNVFSTDGTYDVQLGIGENLEQINASVQPFIRVSSTIFYDLNEDGLMSLDEQVFNGDTIYLLMNNIVVDSIEITEGKIEWSGIPSEVYTLKIRQNEDYALVTSEGYNSIELDNDLIIEPLELDCFHENYVNLIFTDAGADIGDFLWNDLNLNGLQDTEEKGLPGVKLKLIDFQTADLIGETVTNEHGKYLFEKVAEGTYIIEISEVSNELLVTQKEVDPSEGSRVIEFMGQFFMGPIEVQDSDDQVFWDGGFHTLPATIGDFVWIDENRNGIQDTDEIGLANTTVNLYNQADELIAQTETDSIGSYLFTVGSGIYYLEFINEEYEQWTDYQNGADSSIDNDADPTQEGRTDIFDVNPGAVIDDIDAGFSPKTAILGDRVFLDMNEDGLQGANEIGLSNFLVEAYTETGELIASTSTNDSGNYSIEVPEGSCYLKFSKATFDQSTFHNINNEELNSDITEDFGPGTTSLMTVSAFEVKTDIDAGFLTVNTLIGDYVWQEIDINGIQDDFEIGLPNITVNLIKVDEGPIATTETGDGLVANKGHYEFFVDQPGDYYIEFMLPEGEYQFTSPNIQNDDVDSDVSSDNGFGTTAAFFIEPGEPRSDIDAGIIGTTSTIGDFVWRDNNNNGIQDPGEEGVNDLNVFLYDAFFNLIDVTVTSDNSQSGKDGYYEFTEVELGNYILVFDTAEEFVSPKVGDNDEIDSDVTSSFVNGSTDIIKLESSSTILSIDAGLVNPNAPLGGQVGDMVWEDLNKNGIYESVENGVADVHINLVNDQGTVVASTVTSSDGNYALVGVSEGEYRLQVILPEKYEFTIPNNSSSELTDSDVDELGWSEIFFVENGETIDFLDIGLIPDDGIIEGVTWVDKDANGLKDTEEQYLANVAIQLLNEDLEVVHETHTDENGFYIFDGLQLGTYSIKVLETAPFVFATVDLNQSANLNTNNTDFFMISELDIFDSNEEVKVSFGLKLDKTQAANYIDLNAFEDGLIHQLQWTSTIAYTASKFEIQRISVGGEWTTIGELEAADIQHYFMEDETGFAIPGHVGYRIIQYQKDGDFFYSSESWILDDEEIGFTLFPNPSSVNPTITFVVEENQEILVRILRIDGSLNQEILQRKSYVPGEYSRVIDTSSLPSGVYYVRFEALGKTTIEKLIITE